VKDSIALTIAGPEIPGHLEASSRKPEDTSNLRIQIIISG
jgi:hypothetical protein